MAIIYTYPTKATLALADLTLISDSADANKTKQATMASIKDVIDVVDSIAATSPLVASASTGAVTLSIPAATSSVNGYLTSTDWSTFNNKQSELQSGTNIKSILGSGDLVISGSGVTIFDDGSGVGLNIDKFDFIGNGVSAAVDGGDNTKINITIPGGAGTPAGADTQIQYNDGGTSFGAGAFFTTNKSNTLSVANIIEAKGTGTAGTANVGKLRLYCENNAHYIEMRAPVHAASGIASYALVLPQSLPNVANQILESNQTGGLSWIPTPTGSGGISSITGTSPVSITSGSTPVVSMAAASTTVSGYLTTTDWNTFNNKADGISFSGATVSGIATFASTSSATVNSEVKLLANGQMTFDGSSGNTGIKYDSGTSTLRVGDIVGNSDIVALYSDGAAKITVSDSDVLIADTTQFQQGLKFLVGGSTLDKYQEGTWTPTAFVAVGTAPTVTSAVGTYVRIGNTVHITFELVVTGSSSASVAMIVGGLPVNAINLTGYRSAGILYANTDGNTPAAYVSNFYAAGAQLYMQVVGGNKDPLVTPYGLKIADVASSWYRPSGGTGATLKGSCTYRVA